MKQSITVCNEKNSYLINHRSSVGYSWRKLFGWYFNFSFLMFTAIMKAVFETVFYIWDMTQSDSLSRTWLLPYISHQEHSLWFARLPCISPFFLEEFIKHGLKQYVGSVQVQVTLRLCLWNSPEGPGCLVPHDVMQALPFQQNNSVFTACN